jgi:hypothetical protein
MRPAALAFVIVALSAAALTPPAGSHVASAGDEAFPGVDPAAGAAGADGRPVAGIAAPPIADAGSPPVGGVAPVTAAGNGTASLSIPADGVETAGYRSAGLDVAGALALDTAALDAELARRTLDERLEAADSAATRRALLSARAARLDERIARLRERRHSAVEAVDDDPAREPSVLRELALIDATAGRLAASADRLAARAASAGTTFDGQRPERWARGRTVALDALAGPVGERLGPRLRGERPPAAVYVETAGTGLVAATAADGTYSREAWLPGERNATGAGRIESVTAVLDRVAGLYPRAWAANASVDATAAPVAGSYRVGLLYDGGALTTHLDADSGAVFAEDQRRPLAAVETASPVGNTTGTLELTLALTHPTGPLAVSLSRPAGEPVNGTVEIDGTVVGTTGPDGRLWTVAPRGTATVNVTAGNESVRIVANATP